MCEDDNITKAPYPSGIEDMARIILISNEDFLLERLRSITHRLGCIVERVQDDVDTIKPDIIFADISGHDSFIETYERLKKDPATRDIRLIIFLEYRNKENISKSLEAHANDFLIKPIEDFELIANIYDVLNAKGSPKEDIISFKLFNVCQMAKRELQEIIDSIKDIILLTDLEDNIKRCNKTLCHLTGRGYNELLGRKWQEIFKENGFTEERHHSDDLSHIDIVHPGGRRFHINCAFIKDIKNVNYAKVVCLHDVTELKNIRENIQKSRSELKKKNKELEEAYSELKKTQAQLLQQEKMASIGLLAAGIAHEINNPLSFVISNLNAFQRYTNRLLEFLNAQSIAIEKLSKDPREESVYPVLNSLMQKKESLKLDYIFNDIRSLLPESIEGADRVKRIVLDLKNFSRVDEEGDKPADIHPGLDSTINIIWNELKYKVTLKKEYGAIPITRCNLGQLNQVFMNCILNASQAIKEHGEITIKTWCEHDSIYISISDTGCGIPEKYINRIFEPFFTTKEPGKGTGLGLTIAYNIIKRHKGEIRVESEVGKGTTFTIIIPVVE